MNNFFPPKKKKKESGLERTRRALGLAKDTAQVSRSLLAKNPEKAVGQFIVAGLKMANEANPFADPTTNALKLVDPLKSLGLGVLGWSPETLMAAIDKKYNGWTEEKVHEALEHFHKTGSLMTDVPQLVREKIYAIRVIATSNSAQTEWHVFEKIGGAFNDRVVQFGTVEPLTAAECARTVAIIENIRPDTYENGVKIYIGAACHEDGLYTAQPVKWLAMAEPYLQQMNFESTGELPDPVVKQSITSALATYRIHKATIREVPEELIPVQASKLLAIEEYADEVVREV